MSQRPFRCPHCRAVIVARSRPSTTATRLRAMLDLAYGEPSAKPGFVAVQCPGCGRVVTIRGRLIIEQGPA